MILTKTVLYKGHQVAYEDLKQSSKILIVAVCPMCEQEFETTKHQITRNGHEMCRPCALIIKRSVRIPAGTQFGRLTVVGDAIGVGRSVCRCECGTVKEVSNDGLKRGSTRSCGCLRSDTAKRVAAEYLSNYQKRSAHPNWKGGISPIRNCVEKTKVYKSWRAAVLALHSSTCQKCGSVSGVLAHHICNFEDYPDLRIDVANGACLCEKCHRAFHTRYGLKSTTHEQLNEFLTS